VASKRHQRPAPAATKANPPANKPLKPVPTELRRLILYRNERLQVPQCDNQEIASSINRALAAAKAPAHHRATKVYRNATRSIVVITMEHVSADELIGEWHDLIVNAARGVDKGITEVEASDAWIKLRVHGLPLRRFMGRGTEGLRKMKEEIEAENPGCKLLPGVKWLGNPTILRERMRTGEKTASSAVITVKGRKAARQLTQHKAMLGGIKYVVDQYIAAGPDSLCEICSRWGHLQSKCATPTMPRCALCAGKHRTDKHLCQLKGCQAKEGQNCRHTEERCVNCKGAHGAGSRECPEKRAAFARAKEERATWRERKEASGNADHASGNEEDEEEEEDGEGDRPMKPAPPVEPTHGGVTAPAAPPTTTATITASNQEEHRAPIEDEPMGNPHVEEVTATATITVATIPAEAAEAGPGNNRGNPLTRC